MRGIKSKAKKARKKRKMTTTLRRFRRHVLSVSQVLARIKTRGQAQGQGQGKSNKKKPVQKKPIQTKRTNSKTVQVKAKVKLKVKPIIPPKSLTLILKEKPQKSIYDRRIIDYKHCGLLENYIGGGGKILSRRQTTLNAKQQRYISHTIKTARIMGLLPFVSKERGFFR